MDRSTGPWQVTVADPDALPLVAVMDAVPSAPAIHVTRPPATVATLGLPDDQLAELVTICGGPNE
jgi:hypothetical protein